MSLLGPMDAWGVVAGVVALIGAALVTVALIGDRSRGRRRCPRCWYRMDGVPGLVCPECGRDARRESRLFKPRRRWPRAAVGLALVLAAGGGYAWRVAAKGGVWSTVPVSVAVHVVPWYADPPGALIDRIKARLDEGPIREWQRRHLFRRAQVMLEDPASSPQRKLTALELIWGVANRAIDKNYGPVPTGEAGAATPILVRSLDDPDTTVRDQSLMLLRDLGGGGDSTLILPAVLRFIDAGGNNNFVQTTLLMIVRNHANSPAAADLDIVSRLHAEYERSWPAERDRYYDRGAVCRLCVEAAGQLSVVQRGAIEWLGELVDARGDPNACDQLMLLGPRGAPAAPAVARAINRDVGPISIRALQTLAAIGDRSDATRQAMLESLRHRAGHDEAFAAFEKLFRSTPRVVEDLADATKDWSPADVALGIDTSCLGGADAAQFLPLLERAIRQASPRGCERLWRAYKWAFIGGCSDPALLAFIDVTPAPPRGPGDAWRAALRGRMTGDIDGAVAAIARELAPENRAAESWMRVAPAEALGYFGLSAAPALAVLTDLQNDPSREVRDRARESISRITHAPQPGTPPTTPTPPTRSPRRRRRTSEREPA